MRGIGLSLYIFVLLGMVVGCPPSPPGNGDDNGTPPDNSNGDNGDGDLTALLEISPTSHNFGIVNVGGFPATHVFTVTNVGTEPVLVARAELVGPQAMSFFIFLDSCINQNLVPFQICTVSVQFWPQTAGTHTAGLRIVPFRTDVERPVATLVGQSF